MAMTLLRVGGALNNARLDDGIVFVLGTRPEIIKLSPLGQLLGDRLRVVHTGQHYDPSMAGTLFTACGLRPPDVSLHVGGHTRGSQIGSAVTQLDRLFAAWRPAAVVVQGDTNAGIAGALAANAGGVPLVHIEAGLRSFDRQMPEEHNRVVIDHLSDLLCAATIGNRTNLISESIDADRIRVTGNTIVEAVTTHLPDQERRNKILAERGLTASSFVLATIHRPENTDDPRALAATLTELAKVAQAGYPVVLPMHPRTRTAIDRYGLAPLARHLQHIEPIGYREFLGLAAEAAAIVSDSGGVQEEVTVLKRPLVVVRRSTERPESLGDFATLVRPGPDLGTHLRRTLADVSRVHQHLAGLPSPFGDGTASSQIKQAIDALIKGE